MSTTIAFDADMPRDLTDIMLPIPVRKFPSYYTCPTCSALSKPHPTDDKLLRCSNADILHGEHQHVFPKI